MLHPAPTLTVDLRAVAQNTRRLADQLHDGARLAAVVKTNAFGMGAIDVSRAAIAGGASLLCVGRGEEVRSLRAFNVQAPVLVQGETPSEILPDIAQSDTAFSVWDRSQISEFVRAAETARRRIPLHMEVDTGMHRLGVDPESAVELAQAILREPSLKLAGTLTYLACADELDPGPTLAQWQMFQTVLEQMRAARIEPGIIHAADSTAILRFPQTHGDMVRVGLLLFGVRPVGPDLGPVAAELEPAITLQATIVRVATVPVAEGVGYGLADASTTIRRVATVAIGYADGLRNTRLSPITALVHGHRVRQVGQVSMDLTAFDVTHVPSAMVGDVVTLIGSDCEEQISVEDHAHETEFSPWKVLAAIAPRVRRSYLPIPAEMVQTAA